MIGRIIEEMLTNPENLKKLDKLMLAIRFMRGKEYKDYQAGV